MSDFNFRAQDERIAAIFGESEVPEVNDITLNQYLAHLKNHLTMPCYLTGIQDFWWEEPYIFGVKSKAEHNVERKTLPSYMDTFEWSEFAPTLADDSPGPMVKVQRTSDKKWFVLPLIDLKSTNELSNNYQLLDDFVMWYASFT